MADRPARVLDEGPQCPDAPGSRVAVGLRLGCRGGRGWLILAVFVAVLGTGALAQSKKEGSGESKGTGKEGDQKGTGKAGAGDKEEEEWDERMPFAFKPEEFPG